MPRFIFAYHGGTRPETPEEGMEVMGRWNAWLDGMGEAAVDRGNPVGVSRTVSAEGVEDNGGSNPLSGYSIVEADTLEKAIEISKGCPHLDGGTIEVAEIMYM